MVELSVVSKQAQESTHVTEQVPFQPASLDIWDKKYRLTNKHGEPLDADMDATRDRVARALAAVELTDKAQAYWYGEFLWALRRGAIPAGRILSNAGAQAYKPETSAINCTVSGTIRDSMDDILKRLHEAGMTLKGGSGIGYEFSTLRPRGGYVSGAGAYTSGPLSFMDIYDSMCFTISSAGGRRGAQMATFDVGHPDVLEFIRAKRENGRLRQFNLSLLITDEFIAAVRANAPWPLAFPLTQKEVQEGNIEIHNPAQVHWRTWPLTEPYVHNTRGEVACKIFKTISARELWDAIMHSTYDFAEPGFVLVDHINEYNNNWFCENIRATNPCVTADTRLATQFGLIPIGDLVRTGAELQVTVDRRGIGETGRGTVVRPACPAFLTARQAEVFRVETSDGYEIKATEWHDFYTRRGKVKLKDLQTGDEILVQSGKGQFGSDGNEKLGVLLGMITGDGHFTSRGDGEESAVLNFWNDERVLAPELCAYINSLIAQLAERRVYQVAPVAIPERNMLFIRSVLLARALQHYGFTRETKLRVPEVVWRGSEDCVRGYLRALFQTDGTVNVSTKSQACSVRLASSHASLLKDVQMLLANFGVYCSVRMRRKAGNRVLPDGKGGRKEYACKDDYELIIDGESRGVFMREVGFLLANKNEKYQAWAKDKVLRKSQRFATRVTKIEFAGRHDVYDTTQRDHNTVIFNGLVTGQCGEQPLPPFGACLLGSVNLTEFVVAPFTDEARFDWEEYRRVVHIFTRMLDNVVEVNGLPLQEQRDEIFRKRRHGMGFLGLGSTLAMLRLRYGSRESIEFTDKVSKELAVTGWQAALELAKEKGPAPIMDEDFIVTGAMLTQRPELAQDGFKEGDQVKGRVLHVRYSRYMQRVAEVAPDLVKELAEVGARFTHHSSIAPTGTISLSMANNASNGIEPTFAHHYFRNVIRAGRKTKERVDVWSYELLAYRHLVDASAEAGGKLPDYFICTDDIAPRQHVDIQAAAQKWVDSSISKTVNVPSDIPFSEFKDAYLYAHEQGLKGCTTFRFNPEAFQGVLVKEKDLQNTLYRFRLENGETMELRGDEEVEYDGEMHRAANLYDALKEGYFGKF